MNNWTVTQTEKTDLDFVCHLFMEAINYQKRKGYPTYRWDDRDAQAKLIASGKHFKVMTDDQIACVFNVQNEDKIVWRERDRNASFYVHAVLVNPAFKGNRIFGVVLNYLVERARKEGKSTIRLDTWDHNPDLVNYYKSFGFEIVEAFQIPDCEEASFNCRGNDVVLMEYLVENKNNRMKSGN